MKYKNVIAYFMGVSVLILVWFLFSTIYNSDLIIPNINSVINSFLRLWGDSNTYLVILKTISRIFLTTIVSFIVGVGLAIISNRIEFFRNSVRPIFSVFRVLPAIACIVIFLFIFSNEYSPIMVSFIVMVPIIYDNCLTALRGIDKDILDELRCQTKLNFKTNIKVLLPIIKNILFISFIIAFSFGFKAMIMAEYICSSSNTVGNMIFLYRNDLNISMMYAWILVILLFSIGVEIGVNLLKKKLSE